ncbi:hypothetical protein [Niabella hibiscisoli]|uniref:hypothetical protein n=1 Tax=Niabella hibiscisoli TaxID=1825928 RepID=UPI001F0E61BA|nr:hypothetical protein [Niabella hibiscisoli]MCH5718715.1 hypothetical protein [Niabella hibiscisoli]
MKVRQKHIAFITCCSNDWGGSEELWAQTAPILIQQNHKVTLYKETFNTHHPSIIKAKAQGVRFVAFKPKTFASRTFQKVKNRFFNKGTNRIHYNNEHAAQLRKN